MAQVIKMARIRQEAVKIRESPIPRIHGESFCPERSKLPLLLKPRLSRNVSPVDVDHGSCVLLRDGVIDLATVELPWRNLPMARIEGIQTAKRPFTRFAFFMSKRKLGRVITPIKIMAHHPRLLRGYAHMELGQEAANTVGAQLKALVQVKIAMSIGCPF